MNASLPLWSSGEDLEAAGREPAFATAEELRAHRKRQVALSYRLFGAMNWGMLGDGHISARDPERTDAFWLLRYGVAFNRATVADLVLVGPGAEVLEGDGDINMTAYFIHGPVHDARPEAVSAAHTHSHYGAPWSANVELFKPICQEATAFFEDHTIFDDEEVQIMSSDGGKRIAAAIGGAKATILRNHGPLTVGRSVEEAIGWFLLMELVSEVHVKARNPKPISDEAARRAATEIGHPSNAMAVYDFAIKTKIADPTVVD